MTISVDEMCGRVYYKHGMTITYLGEYTSWINSCKFNCSIHGEFSAVPKTLLEGKKNCPKCKLKAMSVGSSFRGGKLIQGVGLMDLDFNLFDDKARYSKIACLWYDMLERCYSNNPKMKAYRDCEVSESWLKCSQFFQDIRSMENYEKLFEGWHLDKDFIKKGCRLYSNETCCIVPRSVNSILTSSRAIRGKSPIGVCFDKTVGKYLASCQHKKKFNFLGYFDSEVLAFEAYKTFKEDLIRNVADENRKIIGEKVYNAMINYKVEITD